MEPYLKIEDEKDRVDFKEYSKLKGVFLHKHIINIFRDKFQSEKEFHYKEISSFIRYDKSIRDKLYSYMSCLEEYLKSVLLENVEIYNIEEDYDEWCNYYNRYNLDESKLYFYLIKKKITFSKLIEIIKNKLSNEFNNKKLKKINIFRNNIMHHNILLFRDSQNWKQAKKEIESVKENITNLAEILPQKYRLGLIGSINGLIRSEKNHFTRINLGEIDYA